MAWRYAMGELLSLSKDTCRISAPNGGYRVSKTIQLYRGLRASSTSPPSRFIYLL